MLRAGSREQGAGKPTPPRAKRAEPQAEVPRKEPLPAPSSLLPKTRKLKTPPSARPVFVPRSEEHTSELQSHSDLVCRLLLEKKNPDELPCVTSEMWTV